MERIFVTVIYFLLGMTGIAWVYALLHEKIVKKNRWVKARRELPVLAKRLGLTVPRVSETGDVGEFKGRYRGYDVLILPESSYLNMRLNRPVECYLSQKRPLLERLFTPDPSPERLFIHEPGSVKPDRVVPFFSGDGSFDRFFSQRFAATSVVPKMNVSHEAFGPFVGFIRRHGGKLKYLELDSKNIRCAFRRGSYKEYAHHSYIQAAELEAVLVDLTAVATFLEDVDRFS